MEKKNKDNLKVARSLWLVFSLFVLYGTLIPFNFSIEALSLRFSHITWYPFIDPDGTRASIPDVVQNILFFVPFGFLGFLSQAVKNRKKIALVCFMGALLSLTVEFLQIMEVNRTTSVTDLITNTSGALIGAIGAYKLHYVFSKVAATNHFQEAKRLQYFYPLIISAIIVLIGSLEPFDFTLDVGQVFPKIKSLIYNPIDLGSTLRDEGVVFFRFFLFSFVCVLFLLEKRLSHPVSKGILLTAIMGIALEAAQIIVASRSPSAQDVVVVLLGSVCGGFFAKVNVKSVKPAVWGILVIMITAITAGIYVLSPFNIIADYKQMSWFPFLPYYEQTTFISLSNFIESALVYFPMGFLLTYFNAHVSNLFIFITVILLLIVFPLELSQGWIEGRYPDITDVIGALSGLWAGFRSCSYGWKYRYNDA